MNVCDSIVLGNTSTVAGPCFDTLTIEADSKRHAQIKIQVFGSIRPKTTLVDGSKGGVGRSERAVIDSFFGFFS